jgi:hypothetical protein
MASYSGLGGRPLPNVGSVGGEYGPLGRRHRGKGRAVPVRCPSIVLRLVAFLWLCLGFPQPTYFGRNRYWLLSHLFAWEAERAARGRVAAFPRSFPRRKAPEEAR